MAASLGMLVSQPTDAMASQTSWGICTLHYTVVRGIDLYT